MSNDEIRDFWMKSLFEQLCAVRPADRLWGHWRMSPKTFDLIRKLQPTGYGAFLWNPTLDPPDGYLLLGRPVEFDDAAEGAVFVVPEAGR